MDWESLGTSLGAGAVIGAALTAALKILWGKMWEKLDSRDSRCEACAKAHAEEIKNLNTELINILKEVRDNG